MKHNLLTRYRDYLQRREELMRLQRNLEYKPSANKTKRYALMSEAFAKVHQSVMAAIYDRTRLHAQRYKLDGLVARFRMVNRQRRELTNLIERIGSKPASERLAIKVETIAEELDQLEQELMADAIKAIDRIIDLESRNE